MAELREYGHIINPILTRQTLSPGSVISGSFSYSNSFADSEVTELTMKVVPQFVFQQDGTPTLFETTPGELLKYDMSDWITVAQDRVTIKKGESITISYTITVPQDANPGGKYATILLVPDQIQEESTQNEAKLNAQVGFTILGSVPGEVSSNSQILNFTVDKHIYWLWPQERISFTTTVANTGNVDYLPKGNIFLHSGDITTPIASLSINSENLVVLPENGRTFKNYWEKDPALFKLTENGVFLNTDYFRIGKITATAKIGYDVEGQRLIGEREVSFWILPLPVIVAILILILVSSVGAKIWKKRKNQLRK